MIAAGRGGTPTGGREARGRSRLRVLHVITGLGVGGAESMLASLVTCAAGEARVVSLLGNGEVCERLTSAGVRVYDLGMTRGRLGPLGILRLARILREEQPDVVQSWMYHADLLALLALKLCGRRRETALAWGVRCSDMDTRRYAPRLKRAIALCARLSGHPDAVVVNSHAGEAVHRALGYHPREFIVIPNGIDTARFRPDPAARAEVRRALGIDDRVPVLAHVARVDPMKDHSCLLAALDRLDGVAVLAVGEGTEALPDRPDLFRLGRRDDVPRLLAASDIAVSSSAFGEGFSNAIAEGMAAGLPVVATDVGDARRIVGPAGRIVPPGDPAALAAAIKALVELGPDGRAALNARARIAAEFPLDQTAAAFGELHARLLAARRGAEAEAARRRDPGTSF